jgi:hypothetical protein
MQSSNEDEFVARRSAEIVSDDNVECDVDPIILNGIVLYSFLNQYYLPG